MAERFSIGLWKRVDKQTKRDELAVDGSQLNFVVYHGHDDNLLVSVSFTPGQEGWYTAQINLDGQPILYGKDLTLIVLSSGMHFNIFSAHQKCLTKDLDFGIPRESRL